MIQCDNIHKDICGYSQIYVRRDLMECKMEWCGTRAYCRQEIDEITAEKQAIRWQS